MSRKMLCLFINDGCPEDCAHRGIHEENDVVAYSGASGCVAPGNCGHCDIPTYCLPIEPLAIVGEGGEARFEIGYGKQYGK